MVKRKIVETRKEEEHICSICQDELGEGTSYLDKERLPCGHLYHKGCISRWLENHNSCPECRAKVYREEPSENGLFDDMNIEQMLIERMRRQEMDFIIFYLRTMNRINSFDINNDSEDDSDEGEYGMV